VNIKDQLNNVSSTGAQDAAFRILKQLQTLSPARQVAGAALLFRLLAARYHLDVRDVLAQTDRRIADALKDPQQRAIKQYLAEEL
jgi:hypothetical protein